MMSLFGEYAIKLKKIMKGAMQREEYEEVLAAINAYCGISYAWNQFYIDEEIETLVKKLSGILFSYKEQRVDEWQKNSSTILFYDGFGLDTRGLALIYAKALIQLKYRVIWVTHKKACGHIPEIEKVLKSGNAEIIYIEIFSSYMEHVENLREVFEKYKPSKAFFYTIPNDVSAAIVFCSYAGCVRRFQINLTDHAFWLGTCAFDISIEFRNYGAGISVFHRNVPEERIRILLYYPWIDNEIEFQGFPFHKADNKVIFSGGSLYKTIGGENKFYRIVQRVLEENQKVFFLYAGEGDDSELRKLMAQYPARVYHVSERKDLFKLLEHVDVYLNTYPMFGGLMTQYSAAAGKPPVTLNDGGTDDVSGLLIDQANAGIEFKSMEQAIAEINKLLRDDEYRERRSEEIKRLVVREEDFRKKLDEIMNKEVKITVSSCPDTTDFLKSYVERFSQMDVNSYIARKKNRSLAKYFPNLFG